MVVTLGTTLPTTSTGAVATPAQVAATTPASSPTDLYSYYQSQGQTLPSTVAGRFADPAFAAAAASLGYTPSNYTISGNNSAANSAILAKMLGYNGTTNPTSISGSGSVNTNQNVGTGLGTAVGALNTNNNGGNNNGGTPTTTTPTTSTSTVAKTVSSSVVDPSTGNTTITYSDGSTMIQPVNPGLAPSYTQATQATQNENSQYAINQQQLTTEAAANIAQLEQDKANALAAAESQYDTDNPEGAGSDKESYLAEIGAKYDTAISEANAQTQTQTQQMDLNHQEALQNIQDELTTAVSTFNANAISTGQTTLSALEKGDGTIDPYDRATLVSQLTTGGQMTTDQANLQIDAALNQATTANDKTLSTEQRANQSAASTAFFKALGNVTDVTSAENDPVLTNLALQSGAVGSPAGYDSDGNPLYSADQYSQAKAYIATQTKGTVAANLAATKAQDAETNALARIAIADENLANTSNKDFTDTITKSVSQVLSINKDAFNAQTPAQLANTISSIAAMSGAPTQTVFGYLQLIASTLPGSTQKIVNDPSFFSKFFGATTTTTTSPSTTGAGGADPLGLGIGGGGSGSSSAGTDPLGIMQ